MCRRQGDAASLRVRHPSNKDRKLHHISAPRRSITVKPSRRRHRKHVTSGHKPPSSPAPAADGGKSGENKHRCS
ncbi:hypothetical protein EVAR_33736_1 [Eumeta japonica]|uniref:Uncharacterized protein n=1 Tax=Eumeta variegata TaxID=151549 RepID=A0A4C1VV91_EUMVA|nr:hypothetical protein EVAR_33736_1 [Eumeta japonica]